MQRVKCAIFQQAHWLVLCLRTSVLKVIKTFKKKAKILMKTT